MLADLLAFHKQTCQNPKKLENNHVQTSHKSVMIESRTKIALRGEYHAGEHPKPADKGHQKIRPCYTTTQICNR